MNDNDNAANDNKFFGYTYLSDTNKIIWYRKVLDYSDRFDLITAKTT